MYSYQEEEIESLLKEITLLDYNYKIGKHKGFLGLELLLLQI